MVLTAAGAELPAAFSEIARVGTIRRQAEKVRALLSDPARTGYIAVCLPEEMPVNETLELGPRLREVTGLGLDAVVVTAVMPDRFSAPEAATLRAARDDGLPAAAAAAIEAALAEHGRAHAQRGHAPRDRDDRGRPRHRVGAPHGPSAAVIFGGRRVPGP